MALELVCGLLFGSTGTVRRAPSIWMGFGAKFGREMAKNGKTKLQNAKCVALILAPSALSFYWAPLPYLLEHSTSTADRPGRGGGVAGWLAVWLAGCVAGKGNWFRLCAVYLALYTLFCVLYTVFCVLCTVYCILCTVYCILYTVYCILNIGYCALC